MSGEALEAIAKPKAKERQAATLKKGATSPRSENFPERGQSREIIGKAIGMSGPTYQRAILTAC